MIEPEEGSSKVLDITFATLMALSQLMGTFGNIASLIFFVTHKKKALATLLYIIICILDTCILITNIPVVASLMNGRDAMLFGNETFCVVWVNFSTGILLPASFAVVTTLSISRTISIVFPFYCIRKWSVMKTLAVYLVGLVAYIGVGNFIIQDTQTIEYKDTVGYCLLASISSADSLSTTEFVFPLPFAVLIGLPSIFTFVSFLMSTSQLLKGHQVTAASRFKKRQASITIALFTGTFLICSSVFFVNCIAVTLLMYYDKFQDSVYIKNWFVKYYAMLVADIFLPCLNSALSSLIYFCRMGIFSKFKQKHAVPVQWS